MIDNYEHDLQRSLAHPKAQTLLKEDFWWNCLDEASPLGNDVGSDTYYRYHRWRKSHPNAEVAQFLSEWLRIMDVPVDVEAWNLLNPGTIKEHLQSPTGRIFSRRMHNRDFIIIALAFSQLVDEGKIDQSVLELAQFALERQALPVVMQDSQYDDVQDHWLERLKQMKSVLDSVSREGFSSRL